jgi:hypothetical protein
MKKQYALIPFPGLAHSAINISVKLHIEDNILQLVYFIDGQVNDIDVPPFDQVKQSDSLWQTTCLECFLLLADGHTYIELNLSPKGYWDIYYFDDYRKPSSKSVDLLQVKSIQVNHNQNGLELKSEVDIAHISIKAIGLSAVIEDKHQSISYWALQHTSDQPDFHTKEDFIMSAI